MGSRSPPSRGQASRERPDEPALFIGISYDRTSPSARACRELAITPREAVFLDDIGTNLKAARGLGMTTIKVVEPDAALAELAAVLGFALR